MITGLPRIAIATSADDYPKAVDMFASTFGMFVDDFSSWTVPKIGAHVGMCQPAVGSNVELMAPGEPDAALSVALQRFLERRGTGLYALMLEADDPDAEAAELALRGINVLPVMPGATGRDLHPNSTHGVLIRIYPTGSVAQPDDPASQPPHVSGITRAIVAVEDADAAAKTYGHGIGLSVTEADVDAGRGVLVAHATAPWGATIELVSVVDASRPFAAAIDAHVTERGQGLVALVLQSRAPRAAIELLAARGIPTDLHGDLGPHATVFGTRFIIEPDEPTP